MFKKTILYAVLGVIDNMARFPSGQRGRTVNPLAMVFVGSNPTLATSLRRE